jgi:hypothetical protein
MPDQIIAFPRAGGGIVPIKAVDLSDGTYSLGTSTGSATGVCILFPVAGSQSGQQLAVNTVESADPGIYLIKIST